MNDVSYQVVRPARDPGVQELFLRVFGHSRAPEMWRWLTRKHREEKALVYPRRGGEKPSPSRESSVAPSRWETPYSRVASRLTQ